ncbi:MAG: CHASE2 domain-containing protein, partial [Cyanobacteria bacterium P01_F01_bin.86]
VGLSRLQPTFGGYVRENNIADVQTLLNFRSGTKTFDVFYSENILAESFNLKRLEGKVVIVGSTDSTFPRFLPISASSNLGNKDTEYRQILPRLGITGAELEAHSTSQIINKVLHNRPLIETIPPFLEDAFILLAGIVGILIGNAFKSPQATFQNTSLLVFVVGSLVASGYLLLYWLGIWFPIFPASSILAITGVTYIAFYQSERFSLIESKKLEEEALRLEEETLRLEEERRKTIDKIFNSIHAGPLQTLASLLRDVRDGKLNQEHLTRDLEFLNKEIRGIGERLRQEAIEDVYFVDTRRGTKLDLTHPMHEVFYEVYSLCLQEDLPGFQSIKVRSVVFEPFDCQLLDLGTRQELCWFLQESLENVGKHAIGTSRLFVTGKKTEDLYAICVDDNGPGVESSHCGEGTQFFQRLEKKLGGEFSRFSKPSGGTVCKLAWPLPNRKGTSLQLQPRNHQNLPFKNFQRKTKLDLSRPLHTLFYEICHSYLQADLPGFQSIETCSFAFEPCHSDHLTIDIRRKLCCCLQASLDNVGRHAPGTTRLLVTGTILNGFYTLSVEDNGPGVASSYTGEGTKLFCQLEVLLSGKFSRVISPVGGTICKLTWPLQSLNGEFTSMGS